MLAKSKLNSTETLISQALKVFKLATKNLKQLLMKKKSMEK